MIGREDKNVMIYFMYVASLTISPDKLPTNAAISLTL